MAFRCLDDAAMKRLAKRDGFDAATITKISRHVEQCTKCAQKVSAAVRAHADPSRPHPLERILATNAARIGDVIAEKYVVDGMLGSGGMGNVVRAKHVEIGSRVAIKLLRPSLIDSSDAIMRFMREARAAAKLTSRHTVRIIDVGRLPNSTPYIVMEYLEGKDLAHVVEKEGRFTPERATDVILDVLDAMEEAHAAGIIHRDLKPQNVLLANDGTVKVLDFGLAKALFEQGREGEGATRTNAMLGSPRYMAPEQIASAKNVDQRADIWSIGATLYHLLIGLPPFVNPNLYVLATQILNKTAPRVRELRNDVSPALDDVVATCLQRSRDARYPSVAALREALLATRSRRSIVSFAETADGYEPTQLMDPSDAPVPSGPIPSVPSSSSLVPSSSSGAPASGSGPQGPSSGSGSGPVGLGSGSGPQGVSSGIPKVYDDSDDTSGARGGGKTVVMASSARLRAAPPARPPQAGLHHPQAGAVSAGPSVGPFSNHGPAPPHPSMMAAPPSMMAAPPPPPGPTNPVTMPARKGLGTRVAVGVALGLLLATVTIAILELSQR